jgi:hypothetical protein
MKPRGELQGIHVPFKSYTGLGYIVASPDDLVRPQKNVCCPIQSVRKCAEPLSSTLRCRGGMRAHIKGLLAVDCGGWTHACAVIEGFREAVALLVHTRCGYMARGLTWPARLSAYVQVAPAQIMVAAQRGFLAALNASTTAGLITSVCVFCPSRP